MVEVGGGGDPGQAVPCTAVSAGEDEGAGVGLCHVGEDELGVELKGGRRDFSVWIRLAVAGEFSASRPALTVTVARSTEPMVCVADPSFESVPAAGDGTGERGVGRAVQGERGGGEKDGAARPVEGGGGLVEGVEVEGAAGVDGDGGVGRDRVVVAELEDAGVDGGGGAVGAVVGAVEGERARAGLDEVGLPVGGVGDGAGEGGGGPLQADGVGGGPVGGEALGEGAGAGERTEGDGAAVAGGEEAVDLEGGVVAAVVEGGGGKAEGAFDADGAEHSVNWWALAAVARALKEVWFWTTRVVEASPTTEPPRPLPSPLELT